MCKENLNCLITEKCTNEEKIRADERAKVLEEFPRYVEKEMTNWIDDAGDAISEVYALAKAFIKEQNDENT